MARCPTFFDRGRRHGLPWTTLTWALKGAVGFKTLHLDRMAAEGTHFTDFYVAQAVCTASRAALMTGCYPNRLHMQGAYNHTSRDGIADDKRLLPLRLLFSPSRPCCGCDTIIKFDHAQTQTLDDVGVSGCAVTAFANVLCKVK